VPVGKRFEPPFELSLTDGSLFNLGHHDVQTVIRDASEHRPRPFPFASGSQPGLCP